jgi:uncharacterized protein (DUF433 family)
VDLSPQSDQALALLTAAHFGNARADAIRAAISLLAWLIAEREAGRTIVAVEPQDVPDRATVPVVPGLEESFATPWRWLVSRPHPWRRQLWIKGRRIAAGDLARTIEIERWDPNRAAAEFELPVEDVLEAQQYYSVNHDLVKAEETENRLAAQGAVGPLTRG